MHPRYYSHRPVSVSVCVRLSQVGVPSKRMNESGWVLAWELHSTYLTLCYKEIHVPSKIRVLPSGILLQTSDLENFATAYRSSKRVINLARERRSERDKLDRRRSTKFIIPLSSDARPLVYPTDRQALSTARFCRTSSFCTVAWQLARCHLTRRIARFLGDS